MTGLPAGWSWVTLNDLQANEPRAITDGPFGSNLTSAHYSDSGARVIRLQNIGDGHFIDAEAYVPMSHYEKLKGHEARAGDLIVASLGEILPKACLVPPDLGPAIVKADCIRVRLGDHVDPRWALYAMQTPQVRQWAADQLHGVGRLRLGLKVIRQLPVPLPPLDEQRRIVDILEHHLSRLDAAERQTESASRRVLAWQRAHADELFWGREDPTFELGELLASPMRNGHSARASASGDGIRTLTLTAVTRGLFTDDFTKVTTADPKRVADLWLRSGDILVQRSNTAELVGTTELYTGPDDWAIFPDLLIRCRVDTARVLPAFAAGAMRTERAHRWLRARAKGLAGSMPKIDQGTIAALRIPVPAMTKQVATVARLAELDSSSARLAASCTLANARGSGLGAALVQAAFTGRLTRSTLGVQQLETVHV